LQAIEESEILYLSVNELIKLCESHVNLIIDLVRNLGAENAMRTLHEANEVKDYGIIGIGIGGLEKEYPPELFTEVFEQARKFGFKTTAHAGSSRSRKYKGCFTFA
jgi:adenosine deaminase